MHLPKSLSTWAARVALPKLTIVKDSLNVIGICLITHFFITLLLLGPEEALPPPRAYGSSPSGGTETKGKGMSNDIHRPSWSHNMGSSG